MAIVSIKLGVVIKESVCHSNLKLKADVIRDPMEGKNVYWISKEQLHLICNEQVHADKLFFDEHEVIVH